MQVLLGTDATAALRAHACSHHGARIERPASSTAARGPAAAHSLPPTACEASPSSPWTATSGHVPCPRVLSWTRATAAGSGLLYRLSPPGLEHLLGHWGRRSCAGGAGSLQLLSGGLLREKPTRLAAAQPANCLSGNRGTAGIAGAPPCTRCPALPCLASPCLDAL